MEEHQPYFDPLYDAYSLRVIDLREILNQHQIYFPSTAKKAHLVELFDKLRQAKNGSLSIDELQKENALPNRSPRRKLLEMTAIEPETTTLSAANTPIRITRSSAREIGNSARRFLPFTQLSESSDEEEIIEDLRQKKAQQESPGFLAYNETSQTSPNHNKWEELMDTPAVTHFPEVIKAHSVQPANNSYAENLKDEKTRSKGKASWGRTSIPTVEIPVHSRSPSSSQAFSANSGLQHKSSPVLPESTNSMSPTFPLRSAKFHGVEPQTSPFVLSKNLKSSPDVQSSSNTSIYASPLKSPSKFKNFANLFPSHRTPLGETNSQSVIHTTPTHKNLQYPSDSEPEFSPTSMKTLVSKDNDKFSSSPVSNSSSMFVSHLKSFYAKDQAAPTKATARTPLSFFSAIDRPQGTYSPNEEFAESLFSQKGVRSDRTKYFLNDVSLSSTENSLFGEQEESLKNDSRKYYNKMGKFRVYGLFLFVLFIAMSLAFWQQEVKRVGFCEIPEEAYPSYISSLKPEPVRSTLKSVYSYLNEKGLKAKCIPCPSSAKCASNRRFVCDSEAKPHIPFLSNFGFKPYPSCVTASSVTDRLENMVKACVNMVEEWYTQDGLESQVPVQQELSESHFHSSVIDEFYEKFKGEMDLEIAKDEFKVYLKQALERLNALKTKNKKIHEGIFTIYSHFFSLTNYLANIINTSIAATLHSKSKSIARSINSYTSSVHLNLLKYAFMKRLQLIYSTTGSICNHLGMIMGEISLNILANIKETFLKSWKNLLMGVLGILLLRIGTSLITYLWSLFISFYSTEQLVRICVKHCVTRLRNTKKKSLQDESTNPRLHLEELRTECFVSNLKNDKDLNYLREASNITQKRVWQRSVKVIDQMVSVRVCDEKSTNKRTWEWIGVLPDNGY
ncbi:LEM domain-containing protein Man1 [Schizosaccharomyces cryophilus OY26]|uniref:LEM domain-containing protein Man1 n=1 Tax=Schizosaccharomyces cryophilus (strain OY26 / ATCC MYA-4695 / CBS 11777 / NBRC 106824 / NRRL Y48691) TaxID=653667 RepID=S9VVJ8_SCHCR|nr:LEM domain-containing protein Man1 [Schizosaccharomyces cryophilus OY26]EPY50194.1 LEM domain-containing protein Man1 [Schizosaccharomyces cryophilus OY26]